MGITCKPVGKNKSIMQRLKNKMEKEQKLIALAKEGKKNKEDKGSPLEK